MAELNSLQKVVADGYHNAFTDLTYWRGHYYLGYRQAQSHGIDPPGNVILLRSTDLTEWEQVVSFDTGGDDRDPKLLATAECLAVSFGTWVPRWRTTRSLTDTTHDLITHVAVTRDRDKLVDTAAALWRQLLALAIARRRWRLLVCCLSLRSSR